MNIYTPFLKLKQNELQALADIDKEIVSTIKPVFDVPRPSKDPTEGDILERLRLGHKELSKTLSRHNELSFFVDNYDLNDTVLLSGRSQYAFILDAMKAFAPTPVVAMNRVSDHNIAAIQFAESSGRRIGLRLQQEDMESFLITESKLDHLFLSMAGRVDHIDVLVDFRHIRPKEDVVTTAKLFLGKYLTKYPATSISCAGSIIPANISDLVKTNSRIEVERPEIHVWEALRASPGLEKIVFGDYGVVSPDYSDAEIGQQLLRQVSTPKAFYPFERSFFIARGSSFENHPKGNDQYFDLADDIAKHRAYRQSKYSTGDAYVYARSAGALIKPKKAGSPGSWTKAMTNAHITFVSRTLRGLP